MRRSPTPSGRAGGRGFWTAERIGVLERLWAEGLAGSAIAERLGTTKDAVVSKAHRLALEARVPDGPPEPRPSRWERRLAALAAGTGITVERLLALRRQHRGRPRGQGLFERCQYIEGDLKQGGRRCGRPTVRHADAWPYCERHLARCRRPHRAAAPATAEEVPAVDAQRAA